MASFWAHFTPGSGRRIACLVLALYLKAKKKTKQKKHNFLFFEELWGLWFLPISCGCFHSILCRITFSGPRRSFICAQSIWLTFIPVRAEVASLQTKSLLSPQILHVFLCSKMSSKKVLGRRDTFICFDIHVRVIGSSVLDLQDKQWHIGVTDIDLERTLESKPGALTACMVSWLCMDGLDMECGRGKLSWGFCHKLIT